MYIDLHSHIDMYKEEEIPQIVNNAKAAGLKIIVTSGIDPKSNRHILELMDRYPILKGSMGIYPIDALEKELGGPLNIDVDAEIEFIKKNRDRVSAIGEIGLDYKNGENKELQKEIFQKLLYLAEDIKKPVIIHSRKAEADAVEMLESTNLKKIVLHCFSGKRNLMLKARDNGWYFTIPTNIVRSEQFQYMAKEVNISHLFCETDSPFLSPFPEKRNEPAFVVESYRKIAEIKKMDLEEVSKIIYMNWQKVFD
jgi:TatD DNase family protein